MIILVFIHYNFWLKIINLLVGNFPEQTGTQFFKTKFHMGAIWKVGCVQKEAQTGCPYETYI